MIGITGATGLLGKNLLLHLLQHDEKIVALARPESDIAAVENYVRIVQPQRVEQYKQLVQWKTLDFFDIIELSDALNDVSQLYHCAANVSLNNSREAKTAVYKANVELTHNIVNACLDIKNIRLCYVSSIGALGYSPENEVINEKSQLQYSDKTSWYSQTKRMAELEVKRGIEEGLDAFIVNPSVILGYDSNRSSAAIFHTIRKGLKFYPPGSNGFIGVDDASIFTIALMNSELKHRQFILNAYNLTYQELFFLIAKGFNLSTKFSELTPFIAQAAILADNLRSVVTFSQPSVSKDTLLASFRNYRYDGSLAAEATGLKYSPLEETIFSICKYIQLLS